MASVLQSSASPFHQPVYDTRQRLSFSHNFSTSVDLQSYRVLLICQAAECGAAGTA
ncbi:hypothetical protein P389DRAFT_168400, partial [Cystobasidium minutum MCA 4210]|uniref:uncharacterized protein n=1 Tax=Cystobasidium minutum MCA 4210 TaxID=1397322 RepID=UPI0034CF82D7|eukprot:jgi/Rhomi1/168400/fgenesh1_kg.2_\